MNFNQLKTNQSENLTKAGQGEYCLKIIKVWDLAQHLLQTGLCEPFEAYLLVPVILLSQICLHHRYRFDLHQTIL